MVSGGQTQRLCTLLNRWPVYVFTVTHSGCERGMRVIRLRDVVPLAWGYVDKVATKSRSHLHVPVMTILLPQQ